MKGVQSFPFCCLLFLAVSSLSIAFQINPRGRVGPVITSTLSSAPLTRRSALTEKDSETDTAAVESKNEADTKPVKMSSVNARLLEEITTEKKRLDAKLSAPAKIEYEEQDLNGISPKYTFLGAALALGMSLASYTATTVLFDIYQHQDWLLQSDNLFANRVSGLLKQVIVGLGALATGIFAFNAVGMTLLGAKVARGVWSGELDPTPRAGQQDLDLLRDGLRGSGWRRGQELQAGARRGGGGGPREGRELTIDDVELFTYDDLVREAEEKRNAKK